MNRRTTGSYGKPIATAPAARRLLCRLLLAAMPVVAVAQDTATVATPPAGRPNLYFMAPLFRSFAAPAKLDISIDPLFAAPGHEDLLYLRRTAAIDKMGELVIGNLREEQQSLQINAGVSIAVSSIIWGMIIKENIEGYLNHQQRQQQKAPPPQPARPPELRRR